MVTFLASAKTKTKKKNQSQFLPKVSQISTDKIVVHRLVIETDADQLLHFNVSRYLKK